jgi:hypothetical protein
MPYIKKTQREELNLEIQQLIKKLSINKNEGEYNYVITKLIHQFVIDKGLNYRNLNASVGILECAKQEFLRTVVAKYEDQKKQDNGIITLLDKNC